MPRARTSAALDSLRPRARGAGLAVRELGAEIVLYDLDRHRAHCLRSAAAAVWRRCDGRTSVAEIAGAVRDERGDTLGPRAVLAAVRRLDRAHLLDGRLPRVLDGPPPRVRRPGTLARRSVLRGVAVTGGLAVLSLTVPTPEAAAATCLAPGTCVQRGSCTDLRGNPCCSGTCRNRGQVCGTPNDPTPWVCD